MWQAIYDEFASNGFTVMAVAMDTAEGARPWIEAAKPTYPCLIDREHRVADLYDMVNVPQAVWIDEAGRIVRPPENAGWSDAFRSMDRTTRVIPAELIPERDRLKQRYIDAIRDWARNGSKSRFALTPDQVRQRLKPADPAIAEAHAHFRLATYLRREGREAEATQHFTAASRLHPESWNMWRQAAPKDPSGLATGPAFFARVDALGSQPYYPTPDLGD